jgi:gliding motility-associated-like protein
VVPTTYTVTGTNTAGCSNTATQTIGLFPVPVINLINIGSPSASVCAGSSSTLAASGVSSYTWNTGSNNTSIVITPSITTTYSVNGTDLNGCAASNSITIGISITPTLTAVASISGICQGFSSSLNVSGATTYTWSTGETSSNITVNPAATTVYSVSGTNGAGCISSATLSLIVYASPTVSIGPDVEVASGTLYQFNPTQSGATSYTWSPATYLSDAHVLNPATTPEGDIAYILTVSSANGCTASDTVNVKALNDLVIANYMSPNGDGQNDTWKVSVPGLIQDYSITIIDSYGKTVYSKADHYNNDFDGTLGGQDLPDGVYYYLIQDGNTTKYKGSITLTK